MGCRDSCMESRILVPTFVALEKPTVQFCVEQESGMDLVKPVSFERKFDALCSHFRNPSDGLEVYWHSR